MKKTKWVFFFYKYSKFWSVFFFWLDSIGEIEFVLNSEKIRNKHEKWVTMSAQRIAEINARIHLAGTGDQSDGRDQSKTFGGKFKIKDWVNSSSSMTMHINAWFFYANDLLNVIILTKRSYSKCFCFIHSRPEILKTSRPKKSTSTTSEFNTWLHN